MTPAELAAAELEAAARHTARTQALHQRGWGFTPFNRHDVKTNFPINRWLMRQGIEPKEQA